MIVTHGWPGSIIEQLKIVGPLTDPTAYGGERFGCVPPRDPLAAGPRVLGKAGGARLGSDPDRPRLGRADEPPRLRPLRRPRRRLGQRRHRAAGAPRRLPA